MTAHVVERTIEGRSKLPPSSSLSHGHGLESRVHNTSAPRFFSGRLIWYWSPHAGQLLACIMPREELDQSEEQQLHGSDDGDRDDALVAIQDAMRQISARVEALAVARPAGSAAL